MAGKNSPCPSSSGGPTLNERKFSTINHYISITKMKNENFFKMWWGNGPITSGGPALKARKFSTINHCAHDSPITLKEQRIIIMDSHIFNHQLFFQNLVAPPAPLLFSTEKLLKRLLAYFLHLFLKKRVFSCIVKQRQESS